MKKELLWAPILGWYALRIGCVPVDPRQARRRRSRQMMAGVRRAGDDPGS